ncbi:hypothetical protein PAMP_015517 [Pampus punctatissimus]
MDPAETDQLPVFQPLIDPMDSDVNTFKFFWSVHMEDPALAKRIIAVCWETTERLQSAYRPLVAASYRPTQTPILTVPVWTWSAAPVLQLPRQLTALVRPATSKFPVLWQPQFPVCAAATFCCVKVVGSITDFSTVLSPESTAFPVHPSAAFPAVLSSHMDCWISVSVSETQTLKVQTGEEVTLLCSNRSTYPTQTDWFRVVNRTKVSCISSMYGSDNKTSLCDGFQNEKFEMSSNVSTVFLKIKPVDLSDSGLYFCGFYINEHTVIADVIELSVQGWISVSVSETQTLKVQTGEEVTLLCSNRITYQTYTDWFRVVNRTKVSCISSMYGSDNKTSLCDGFQNEKFEMSSNVSTVFLKIKPVDLSDSGLYFCGFYINRHTVIADVIELSVQGWISVSVSETQTLKVQTGEEVTLLCSNRNTYQTYTDWFRVVNRTKVSCISSMYGSDNKASLCDGFQNEKFEMSSNVSTVFLKIKPVDLSDSGLYFCGFYINRHIVIADVIELSVQEESDGRTNLMSLILGGVSLFLTIVIIVLGVKIRKLQTGLQSAYRPLVAASYRTTQTPILTVPVWTWSAAPVLQLPRQLTALVRPVTSKFPVLWQPQFPVCAAATFCCVKVVGSITDFSTVLSPESTAFPVHPSAAFLAVLSSHMDCWISVSVSETQTLKVQTGEEVTLLCSNRNTYQTQTDWFRVVNRTKVSCISSMYGSDNKASLCDGFQNEKFEMSSNVSTVFLKIKPVDLSDSGLYFCGFYINGHTVIADVIELRVQEESDGRTNLMSLILGAVSLLITIVVIVVAVKIWKHTATGWISVSVSETQTLKVQTGEEVTLLCSNRTTNSSQTDWFRVVNRTKVSCISSMYGSDNKPSLCDGFQNEKFEMSSNVSTVFLKIKPVDLSDSGLYFCGFYINGHKVIADVIELSVQEESDERTNLMSLILGAVNIFLTIVIIVLGAKIWKLQTAANEEPQPERNKNLGSEDLNYAALSFQTKPKRHRGPASEREKQLNVVYAATR